MTAHNPGTDKATTTWTIGNHSGHFEVVEDAFFAVCDDAAIVTQGDTEDDARIRMGRAIEIYERKIAELTKP